MIEDKVALVVAETGCDWREAELALEMCGYSATEAIRAISRLLRNIIVLRGKWTVPSDHRVGLFLTILNARSSKVLRSRAVLSYNPAVYEAPLECGWFDFEKHIYGCRLQEGSLPLESLDIEQGVSLHFRSSREITKLKEGQEKAVAAQMSKVLGEVLGAPVSGILVRKELLDLSQFRSLRRPTEGTRGTSAKGKAVRPTRREEPLVLRVSLETDPAGIAAESLHAGDVVSAQISDKRDIAQYLSRIFGGRSDLASVSIAAPIEAVETLEDSKILARVRFSPGVCGDAVLPREVRLKTRRPTP